MIHANGVTIDLSMSRSEFTIDKMESRHEINAKVVGAKPTEVFHYYMQYSDLRATFGYNLLAQPVGRTDQIKCTFSQLTDLDQLGMAWPRDRFIAPVALPTDLKPLVVHSGQVIAIDTYPAGRNHPAVIHYLQLMRMDMTPLK